AFASPSEPARFAAIVTVAPAPSVFTVIAGTPLVLSSVSVLATLPPSEIVQLAALAGAASPNVNPETVRGVSTITVLSAVTSKLPTIGTAPTSFGMTPPSQFVLLLQTPPLTGLIQASVARLYTAPLVKPP